MWNLFGDFASRTLETAVALGFCWLSWSILRDLWLSARGDE